MVKPIYFNGLMSWNRLRYGGFWPPYVMCHDFRKTIKIPTDYKSKAQLFSANKFYKWRSYTHKHTYFSVNCSFSEYPYNYSKNNADEWHIDDIRALIKDQEFIETNNDRTAEILLSKFHINANHLSIYPSLVGNFYKGSGIYIGKSVDSIRFDDKCGGGLISGICDDSTSPCEHFVQMEDSNDEGNFMKSDEIYEKFWVIANLDFNKEKHFNRS